MCPELLDTYWECEKCGMTLVELAGCDKVMYETTLQCWICLRCSRIKPEYAKLLRKERFAPERRLVERSKHPRSLLG